MIQELEKTKSGEQILQEVTEGLANLETEIKDMKQTVNNSSDATQKESQKEMVRLQQLLKETKSSEEDDSMEGMPYTPQEKGINNSDSQSVTMDSVGDDNYESYKTTDEMSQDDTLTYKKMETSDKEESSTSKEDNNNDGHNAAEDYDEQVMPITGEIERKREEEKEG